MKDGHPQEPGRRLNRLRGRGKAAAGAVGSDGIVLAPPLLDQHGRLRQRVEDLPVQQLVPELAVEALVVAVLPRAARLDKERLDAHAPQPPPHELRGELRSVVRPQILGRPVSDEQIGQQLQRTPVVRPRGHEVVRPDVAPIQRPQPDARSVVEPQPTSLRLPLRDLQPLLPPDPLHPLVVHPPALDAEHVCDASVAVAAESTRESHDITSERPLVTRHFPRPALGRAWLPEHPARSPLRRPELLTANGRGVSTDRTSGLPVSTLAGQIGRPVVHESAKVGSLRS